MHKLLRSALMFTFGAALVACAPGYKKFSIANGGGYYDEVQDDGTYKVSYVGNAETSEEESKEYALRRAAELTLEEGATYFSIVTGETQLNTQLGAYGTGALSSSPKTEMSIRLHVLPPEDAENRGVFNAEETLAKMIALEAARKE